MAEEILYQNRGRVAVITINRPETRVVPVDRVMPMALEVAEKRKPQWKGR